MKSKVYRLAPAPNEVVEQCAKADGKKPGEWLNQLILDYAKGLAFPPKTDR